MLLARARDIGIVLVRGLAVGERMHVLLALGIGTTVAAYTLFDKAGLRHAQAFTYLELVILPSATAYPLLIRRPLRPSSASVVVVSGVAALALA